MDNFQRVVNTFEELFKATTTRYANNATLDSAYEFTLAYDKVIIKIFVKRVGVLMEVVIEGQRQKPMLIVSAYGQLNMSYDKLFGYWDEIFRANCQPFMLDVSENTQSTFENSQSVTSKKPTVDSGSNSAGDKKTYILPATLFISNPAIKKLVDHAKKNPHLECGGFLIGNRSKDTHTGAWTGMVDDIYTDSSVGQSSTYTFTSQMSLDALNYCKGHYLYDWDLVKHPIGNYHSHGMYDAFFSQVDYMMMRAQASDEFYVVYSPSSGRFVALFIDVEFVIHPVGLFLYDPMSNINNEFNLGSPKPWR
jgi:proteasome lid subunit RPN8/RPN11